VAITDGTDSHNPDDPTTSVNRNVTVPDGNPDTPIPKPYDTTNHPQNKHHASVPASIKRWQRYARATHSSFRSSTDMLDPFPMRGSVTP
jgi:hypothetical protein